jgi:hypothetical protein
VCDVPSIAVFCSESIECFPGTASIIIIVIIIIIIIIIVVVVIIIIVVVVFVVPDIRNRFYAISNLRQQPRAMFSRPGSQ